MTASKPTLEPFSAARLSKPMSKLLQECNEKPRLEWEVKHLSVVLRVDCAHVVMLAEQGFITRKQVTAILHELDSLNRAGPGNFSTEPGYGSIVLQIEKILAARIGEDIAGRLPTARSRLDQGATVRRIVDRDNVLGVATDLIALQGAITTVAERHGATAMINYTHLQQAQPATFGHYLLAFRDRLQDSFDQLTEVYVRIDRSPLGAVGLSGTDLPIDRTRTASLLGFAGILDNSRLGRDGYYQVEVTFALALMMTVLNDLCTELHIFSSTEFGTIELDDSHCSTSSVFPQKKNPYALETVKGKAAEAQGWVSAAMALFRNEGTGDHASRTVTFLGDSCKAVTKMLQLTAEIILGLKVVKERYEVLLKDAWVTTSRLGNILLIKHGLDYRSAHGVVGRLVKNCLAKGVAKTNVTIDMLQEAAKQMKVGNIDMSECELRSALDHAEFIEACTSFGSVGPREFERLLTSSHAQYCQNSSWIASKMNRLEEAEKGLQKTAGGFTTVAVNGSSSI